MSNEERFKRISHDTLNDVLKFTPIVCKQNPPSAIPIGSSVFIKVNDEYFILSAGHLLNLKDWPDLIVPGINDSMIWLNGVIATTYKEPHENKKIDFGLLKFSDRQLKHFTGKEIRFLDETRIIINHQINMDGHYLIAGYPVSGVKKKSGKAEFHPIPIKIISQTIELKYYERNNFNPEHFILIKYQRKLANSNSKQKQISKEVRGISGSGLWYVPNWYDREDGEARAFLVGIMTENYKDKGFLVALRIDFYTETIKQCFGNKTLPSSHFNLVQDLGEIHMSEIK